MTALIGNCKGQFIAISSKAKMELIVEKELTQVIQNYQQLAI